jgi:cobalamin biosynthesis protein CobT
MNTLTNALPIVAAAYGRKFNVPVQVGGDQACTDGTTIRIPQLVDTPVAKTLAWGYLAHEAGHLRHTDFHTWQSIPSTPPLLTSITNILEDVRIENAMIGSYPGTRQTLNAVLDWMIEEGQIAAPSTQDEAPRVFVNALLVLARHRYRQQSALARIAQQAEQALRQVFPSSFVHRLLGLMTKIRQLGSTAESLDLAQRIVALMEQEAHESPKSRTQEQSQPEEEPRSDARNQSDENQQQQEDQAHPTESNRPDQQEPESQGTERQAEADSQSEHGEAGQPHDAPSNAQAPSALQQVLSADNDELPEDVFEAVAEALSAQSTPAPMLLPTAEHYAGDPQQGLAALHRVKVHSAKLTARLQGLVQAHTQTQHRTVRHGRQLSPRHLHRAGVGDTRIFRVKDQTVAPNTALHLLVDLSGSMAGGQDSLALDAAMALALALEPIRGVSRAVTVFPGRHGQDERVTSLLAHGQRVASHAGAFVQRARGGTPMTGALWFAAADLLSRPEDRKVIVTLTDGAPNHFASALDLVQRASSSGIELIGIGIQTDVSALFPVAIRIDDITDLKRELFRIAERLLLSTHH